MGQFEDLRTFVSVVDNGGIAKAAEDLNVAKSAVSRRLSQMEDRYGVTLINRKPRLWEITTAGQELYQRASRMVAEVDELDADFQHNAHNLKGPLAISVAREFGLAFLKPALFEFASRYPEIDLMMDFDDRTVDLERENYDMAIRITGSVSSELMSHRLGVSRHGLFASPGYVAKNGQPKSLEELNSHALLHYGAARRAEWTFECARATNSISFQPELNSNCGPFLFDAVINGLGIARLPDFISDPALKAGEIVRVLPDLKIADWGIYLVYNANRRLNRRMRALMELLEAKCSSL
ncbi:MAG: LysR family transcriptional regulator [Pseudomonadota bacterium]